MENIGLFKLSELDGVATGVLECLREFIETKQIQVSRN